MERDISASAALDELRTARAALADRLVTPWWYHLVAGLGPAAVVASNIVEMGSPWRLPVSLVAIGLPLTALGIYTRVTGVSMTGWEVLPRWMFWACLAAFAVLYVAAFAIGTWTDERWLVWALAVLAFGLYVVGGRSLDSLVRSRLRAGA